LSTDSSLDQDLQAEISSTAKTIREFIFRELLACEVKDVNKLYDASLHLFKAGGKMLRPYLTVKSCELLGGNLDKVIPAAAAVEVLHTFTLIHDDIIDRDTIRRGVPSVHARWDEPTAIIAGDLLFAKVFTALSRGLKLREVSDSVIAQVVECLSNATVKICEGQMLDMEFERRNIVSEEEYLTMIEFKTAYLFKASAEVGALVAEASDLDVEHIGEFARLSGVAFQMVDDVLGLTADEAKLGKPVGSDLREGKKTLPIIYALAKADEAGRNRILKAMKGETDISEALNLIISLGSIKYVKAKAEEYLGKALKKLEVFPEFSARRRLESLAIALVRREF
jgi:geranylgeranyl diphosphate synthase type I